MAVLFLAQNTEQPSDQSSVQTSSKKQHTAKASISPTEATSLYALDKISQSILYTKISYLELSSHQNIEAAISWLDLAFELIKQSKTDQIRVTLEEMTRIKEKLKQQNVTGPETINKELDALLASLTMTHHHTSSESTQNETAPKTTVYGNTRAFLFEKIRQWSSWLKTSIHIERISNDDFLTIRNTLSSTQLQAEISQLVKQAKLAAQFGDTLQFQYACEKIRLVLSFYIHNPQKRQEILAAIDTIKNKPVEIEIPDYTALLRQLNQITRPIETDGPIPSSLDGESTP